MAVYQEADGSFTDENGQTVYSDELGGYVYANGEPVEFDDDGVYEADTYIEPVIFEDGNGGYVDENGEAAFMTSDGHWVDSEGYLLTGTEVAVETPAPAAAPLPVTVRRGRDANYEELSASDGCGARAIVGLFTVIAVLALGLGWWGWKMWRKIDPPGEPGAQIASLIIPKETTRQELGKILEEEGVISDSGAWDLYVKLAQPQFQAGEYVTFRKNMSFPQVMEVLDEGPEPIGEVTIVFPEGITLADAVGLFIKKFPQYKDTDFYTALSSGQVKSKYLPNPAPNVAAGFTPWEGLLLPNTYKFADNSNPAQLLQKLADAMSERLDDYGYADAQAATGYTPYQVLTFASMIEKETAAPEERTKISRVIYNRLEAGDFLGIDATTNYGQKIPFTTPLTTEDFKEDDPYNTRRMVADKIPPTPISLPSDSSLKAAIAPEAGKWKWYVVDTDPDTKTHVFCETIEQFNAAKAAARAAGELPG